MQYIVSASEMKRIDRYTIDEIGIPAMVLMERAALAVRDSVLQYAKLHPDTDKRVLIYAGTGNNGADGLALARMLMEDDFKVDVISCGEKETASKEWICQKNILENYGLKIQKIIPDKEYDYIIDALFGVGLSRNIEGSNANYIKILNEKKGRKIAIDIPSGIDATTGKILGTAFMADETLTFGYKKRGCCLYPGCLYAGSLKLADIGIPTFVTEMHEPEMFCLEGPPMELLPHRIETGNKGTFGKVLLIAGCVGMAGAAVLAANAAYRVGAGMVKVISDENNREIIQTTLPEALFGTYEELDNSLQWADIIAVGPGIGKSKKAVAALKKVITCKEIPLIMDADALNILSENSEIYNQLKGYRDFDRPLIMTPHPGELSRLLHKKTDMITSDLIGNAKSLSSDLGALVVAKDARTMICGPTKEVCINMTGNSGMATAGSGDVLTGIIAGLCAQGMDAFRAACVGVYVHGCYGDLVSKSIGQHACMAGDLMRYFNLNGRTDDINVTEYL